MIAAPMDTSLGAFQEQSGQSAIYPTDDLRVTLLYLAVGLADEAGEVAGKVKKWVRRGAHEHELATLLDDIEDESGDVLWYMAQLFEQLGGNIASVPRRNLEKLAGRVERGTLEGSGDKR